MFHINDENNVDSYMGYKNKMDLNKKKLLLPDKKHGSQIVCFFVTTMVSFKNGMG